MEQRLTIVTLGVSNVDAAASFYENAFGWKRAAGSSEAIVFFGLNGLQLALFAKEDLAADAGLPANPGGGFPNFTLAHNVGSESEVDGLFAQLGQKGVRIVKAPEKVHWGGYSGYVADMDGYLWEIAYNPFLPLDERGNVQGQ